MSMVRDDIERLLIASDFFEGAPFSWIGVIIRYGLRRQTQPDYERINKKHGDLPIAIELDANELRSLTADELRKVMAIAVLEALLDVARQFDRPSELLSTYMAELNGEPTTPVFM
jgi:Immunity protein 39